MKGRKEDNSVISFINLVKFRKIEQHQNSICVIAKTAEVCCQLTEEAEVRKGGKDTLSQEHREKTYFCLHKSKDLLTSSIQQ
jgi:hypothetical protein